MAKEPGKCIFCGGSGLTKEHIRPEWLQRYLPKQSSHTEHFLGRGLAGDPPRIEELPPSYRKRQQGDPLVRKLHVVCRMCNTGWMSRLQKRAKPALASLITGSWRPIEIEEQKIIAAWLVMTAMVNEFSDPSFAAVPAAERLLFSETQEPPLNWRVWIGDFSGEGDRSTWHTGMTISLEPLSLSARPNAQISTFTVGRMILHALSVHDDASIELRPQYAFNLGLVPIWPPQRYPVQPFRTLDDHGANKVGTWLPQLLAIVWKPQEG